MLVELDPVKEIVNKLRSENDDLHQQVADYEIRVQALQDEVWSLRAALDRFVKDRNFSAAPDADLVG